MSTLTYAKPHRSSGRTGTQGRTGTPRPRIVSGRWALVFLSEFCALTSFSLLLSVTPMYAAAAGAGSAGAGLVTSVLLLGTVAAELAAPILMRRYGYWAMLVAGVLLLGVPALALLPGGSLVILVTVSVVRLWVRPRHGDDRRPHGGPAAARTARRGTGPVRGRGHRAGNRGAAGRCLACWPRRHGDGRRHDGRDCPRSARGVPVAVRTGGPPQGGGAPHRPGAARWAAGRASPSRAAAAVPHLRGQHRGGRRCRLVPSAGRRDIRQRRRRWPARSGPDRDGKPLVGGAPRRPDRPRAPAGPGVGDRVAGHDHDDLAGLPCRRDRGHVPVRHRVRHRPERHFRADDRPHACVRARDGQRPVEPGV